VLVVVKRAVLLINGQHGFALGQTNNKMLVYLIHSALAINQT
jgi:hypothetical protein